MTTIFHGTSSSYLDDIAAQGLRNPHLTTDRSLAVAYAEEQVAQAINEGRPEGRPVLFALDFATLDASCLRLDANSMLEDQAEWESYGFTLGDVRRAAGEANPAWLDVGGRLRLPPDAWRMSLRFSRTVLFEGIIPAPGLDLQEA